MLLQLAFSSAMIGCYSLPAQLIVWISLLLLLSNAQSSKLILHRFNCVTVIDVDFDYFYVA